MCSAGNYTDTEVFRTLFIKNFLEILLCLPWDQGLLGRSWVRTAPPPPSGRRSRGSTCCRAGGGGDIILFSNSPNLIRYFGNALCHYIIPNWKKVSQTMNHHVHYYGVFYVLLPGSAYKMAENVKLTKKTYVIRTTLTE
jgi:hypothetical protein